MGPEKEKRWLHLAKYQQALHESCNADLDAYTRTMACFRANRLLEEIQLRDSTYDWR